MAQHTLDKVPAQAGGWMHGALLLSEMAEHQRASTVNLILALVAVGFAGTSIVLIVLNSIVPPCEELPDCVPACSIRDFHLLEFWSSCLFNINNVFVIAYTPKGRGNVFRNAIVFKVMVFLTVCVSFIGAVLITISIDKFEVASHELEYCNEVIMALIDSAMLASLLWVPVNTGLVQRPRRSLALTLGTIAVGLSIACMQLGIYNGLGWEDGTPHGEQVAHFIEFSFGLAVACVTFSFAMDNKLYADAALASLREGPDDGACVVVSSA